MQEYIRARAPLRIGLAGGGTDVEPYSSEKGGCVLNTTIDKYAYCTVFPNNEKRFSVNSLDYGTFEAPSDGGPLNYDGNMDLIKAVKNHFQIKEGFDIFLHSDAPPGSGLGGSSTVMVAVIAAVAEWLEKDMSHHEMAELAYVLERKELGLRGGRQDQYTAVFGGFNFMEFNSDGVRVNPLRLRDSTTNELQYCSLLCYTGTTRESKNIIESQMNGFKAGNNVDALDASKELAKETAEALKNGDIRRIGELLNESWIQKKQFSTKISNNHIDQMYSKARESGAVGGKVSGAGGGGFMFFVCEYDKKHTVAKTLMKMGATTPAFSFEEHGVKTWRHKE